MSSINGKPFMDQLLQTEDNSEDKHSANDIKLLL